MENILYLYEKVSCWLKQACVINTATTIILKGDDIEEKAFWSLSGWVNTKER